MHKMNARYFVQLLLAGLLAATSAGAAESKPNILFILVDDFGIKDVGVEGSAFYETPNIDALARSGMRFTRGYAACQVCSPSRASIMLGKNPARHGITDYLGAKTGDAFAKERGVKLSVPGIAPHMPKNDITLAAAFKNAGYATFFAGKWHLGDKGVWPENFGFDINKGGYGAGSPDGGYYAPWKNPTLPSGPRGQSLTHRLASETISFIEQHRDKPFLAYLSFYAVHGPIETTKPLWEKYREKAARQNFRGERFNIDRTLPVRQVQDNPIYAGLIDEMDSAVGRVLARLKELGMDKNTIVVFTSDNGGVVSGDSFSSCQFPYRGGKGRQWEGGLRVPFYIKAPGVTQPGSTSDTPVIHTDFYPTLLTLAGLDLLPHQHMDGVSLLPLLKGGKINDRPLFWHYPHYANQGGEPSSIIRKDGWKLIHYWEDNHNELYHLPDDTGEQHDLASQQPERVAALWTELKAWLKETGAKFPHAYAGYNPSNADKARKAALDMKTNLEKMHARFLTSEWQPDPTWWKSLVPGD